MTSSSDYTPPRLWAWNEENRGREASKNRPVSGPKHDRELPIGRHPLQLYSVGTPNGVKVTVTLEELLALGHMTLGSSDPEPRAGVKGVKG